MSTAFRLPNGESTQDQDTYVNYWRAVASVLEEAFPGYCVYGFDPGFALRCADGRGRNLEITAHAAMALYNTWNKR